MFDSKNVTIRGFNSCFKDITIGVEKALTRGVDKLALSKTKQKIIKEWQKPTNNVGEI